MALTTNDRTVVATDTTSVVAGIALPSATNGSMGLATMTTAYMCGGEAAPAATAIYKWTQASETISTSGNTLPVGKRLGSASNGTAHGYMIGGHNGSSLTNGQKFLFSNDTSTTTAGVAAPVATWLYNGCG